MTKARECGAKHRHPSGADAERHVWGLIAAGARRARFSIYRRKFCSAWHVGHKRKRR